MKQEGHQIWNYIDDFLCVALPSKIQHSFARLQNLLQELGLTISQKKLVALSTKVVCLGILVNAEDCSVSIPEEKLSSTKQVCTMVQKIYLYQERVTVTFRLFIVHSQMYQICKVFLE